MSETSPGPLASAALAQRLAQAARATASRVRPGRCSAPVAVDAWDSVSERCPLGPGHDDEHEVESDTARRERLQQAAATRPGQVLVAVEAVVAWLAEASGAGVEVPLPVRELWTLVDVAEATAALDEDERALDATASAAEVRTDG